MERIMKMYGSLGLDKVKKVAIIQAEIDAEVAFESEINHDIIQESDLLARIWDAMPEMNPMIRTRHEMVVFIATLELIASALRDEIADKAYQEEEKQPVKPSEEYIDTKKYDNEKSDIDKLYEKDENEPWYNK